MKRDLRIVKRPAGPSMARIKQAVRLFRSELAPRSVRRHNARAWLRAVEMLGPKWLFAQPIRRTER